MTKADILKTLLVEYQEQVKDFEKSKDKDLECFWKGACFALKIAIKEIEKNA